MTVGHINLEFVSVSSREIGNTGIKSLLFLKEKWGNPPYKLAV
jgi:hypothetical protein